MKIEDVVSRRTDLSTFLVHLTRAVGDETARGRLISILKDEMIKARFPFGPAVDKLKAKKISTDSQRAVCFTETPLEHVYLLTQELEDRRNCQFEPYGIAITKKQGRKRGVNPVWYIDITSGHPWLMKPLNKMIDEAISAGDFDSNPLSKLTPFIEQMGSGHRAFTGEPYRKEFWWEREWRHVGDFGLPGGVIVLCPTNQITSIQKEIDELPADEKNVEVKYIDPRWSMEKIIGRLAGIPMADLGPF